MNCSYRTALLSLALLAGSPFAAAADLSIVDPYIRPAPPNAPATAAFMTIHNNGKAERKLVKAESPAAKVVELHNHINDNGVMKMRQVPFITVKAGGQAELKPGSYHVMLIGMLKPIKEGDAVPLTLGFDDGSSIGIDVPVRAMPAGAHQGMKH